jgi:hypothetical protein
MEERKECEQLQLLRGQECKCALLSYIIVLLCTFCFCTLAVGFSLQRTKPNLFDLIHQLNPYVFEIKIMLMHLRTKGTDKTSLINTLINSP